MPLESRSDLETEGHRDNINNGIEVVLPIDGFVELGEFEGENGGVPISISNPKAFNGFSTRSNLNDAPSDS